MKKSPITPVPSKIYDSKYFLEGCGGFENFKETKGVVLEPRQQVLFSMVNPKPGMKILDLGCGRGEFSHILSKEGVEVFGLDYSSHALQIAKESFPQMPTTRADAGSLPFKEKFFDRVVVSDVIEHLYPPHAIKMLREISRVLKKDGLFCLHTFPNKLFYDLFYPWNYWKKSDWPQAYGPSPNPRTLYEKRMHVCEYTPKKLKNILNLFFEIEIHTVVDVKSSYLSWFSDRKNQKITGKDLWAIGKNNKNEKFVLKSSSVLNSFVDLTKNGFLPLGKGWFDSEVDGTGSPFRWTHPQAELFVGLEKESTSGEIGLFVPDLNETPGPKNLEISFKGKKFNENKIMKPLVSGDQVISFSCSLPSGVHKIKIKVDHPYLPGGGDPRELGIAFRWIKLK